MRAVLIRFSDNGFESLGRLLVFDGMDQTFSCFTLEPPWKDNEHEVSCIPPGHYRVESRYSAKFGDHLAVHGVPDRTAILVHVGNFRSDTSGCILVGDSISDINGDGQPDIIKSRATLHRLVTLLTGPMALDIIGPQG